jgi:hypothetical protein
MVIVVAVMVIVFMVVIVLMPQAFNAAREDPDTHHAKQLSQIKQN